MTGPQKRLMGVSIALLLAWATEGKLHSFDTTSTTYAGLVFLLLPRFGVMTWKDVQSRIPWGTVIVFGVGISLGTALLTTQAGQWLGGQVVANTGLDQVGPLGIFAILGAFLILIHLGFASATALTSALLPILIAVLQTLPGEFNRLGMTMLLGFVVSYGFILPINAPQNMVCLGTQTFTAKQFAQGRVDCDGGGVLADAAVWRHVLELVGLDVARWDRACCGSGACPRWAHCGLADTPRRSYREQARSHRFS
jgi:solute carrier family 13 (sodium-dependent dicarboxylate transporter), member 2/3/5